MLKHRSLPAITLAVSLAAAACGGGGTPSVTPAPSAPPTAEPSPTDAIVHPTGADEIVLRLEEVGGFVPMEWLAARLPVFTLYGDGRVVFVQATLEQPPRSDGVIVGWPLRTVVLSEDQVQELLVYALSEGGLAIAKTDYANEMVADASTSVFTINAANDSKTVSAYALGLEGEPNADTQVLQRLAALADRLRDFDRGGSQPTDPYLAKAFRATLIDQGGMAGGEVRDWPWTTLEPADFTLPADPNALPAGTHPLTADEVAAVGIDGFENGITGGAWLRAPDGTTYSLVIRPLLPDEEA